MPESSKKTPDPLSKTKRKQEMTDLQKLGEALMGLADSQLAKIPLPDELLKAIRTGRTLKAREAIRRHLQYVGKIMRGLDPELIQAELSRIKFLKDQKTTQFKQTEQWRDRLIAEGDSALQEFMHLYPHADRQHMRQLIRKAQQDKAKNKDTGGDTELFRYIRGLI